MKADGVDSWGWSKIRNAIVYKKKKGLDNLHYQDLSVGGPDGFWSKYVSPLLFSELFSQRSLGVQIRLVSILALFLAVLAAIDTNLSA